MGSFQCAECRAIYQELREAHRAATQNALDQHGPLQQIIDWVQQLSEEECASDEGNISSLENVA